MADIIIPIPTEVSIEILAREYTQWRGTAQHLIDEGLIPVKGFDWPQADASKHWKFDGFNFWLRRTRPAGMNGPMRAWLENDFWFVRRGLISQERDGCRAGQIYEKQMALREVMYRGSFEHGQQCQRYWRSQDDDAYQSFKALIGLCPPKKERKSRTTRAAEGKTA